MSSFMTASLQASFGSSIETIKVQSSADDAAPCSIIMSILSTGNVYEYGSSPVGCLNAQVKANKNRHFADEGLIY